MNYISINKISRSFGTRQIFSDLSLQIHELTNLGIVGPNGHGKSTFIRTILQEEECDSGNVSIPKNTNIGYFSQHFDLNEEFTIEEELQNHFGSILENLKLFDELSLELGNHEYGTPSYEEVEKKFQKTLDEIEINDGFNLEHKIDQILNNFNFEKDVRKKQIKMLSGGERSRLVLAKILSQKNDVLILDEPTNHLDFKMMKWLESYLKTFEGAKIIISHDRYFLNQMTDQILEIENGHWKLFTGNYDSYIAQKQLDQKQQMQKYLDQQALIAKEKDFIAKNMASISTVNRAKSRRKMLEKMEIIEKPNFVRKLTDFKFSTDLNVSKEVLNLENLKLGFSEDKIILNSTTFTLFKDKVVGIVGDNGQGKSTFINALVHNKNILSGKLWFSPNAKISVFDQHLHVDDENQTVANTYYSWFPMDTTHDMKSTLGRFLFNNDSFERKVNTLSGGERSRLFLAQIYRSRNNVIILDEPTNHLDITSTEVIEEALKEYNGTLIIISHDRYFLNRLCNQIWEIKDQKLNVYDGNFNDYLEQSKN